MAWGFSNIKDLIKAVAALQEELVTTRLELKNQKERYDEKLQDQKNRIQVLEDRYRQVEKERNLQAGEYNARMIALELRLDMLSEKAMLAAAKEGAKEAYTEFLDTEQKQDAIGAKGTRAIPSEDKTS